MFIFYFIFYIQRLPSFILHILSQYVISLTNLRELRLCICRERIFQEIYGDAWYYSQRKLLLSSWKLNRKKHENHAVDNKIVSILVNLYADIYVPFNITSLCKSDNIFYIVCLLLTQFAQCINFPYLLYLFFTCQKNWIFQIFRNFIANDIKSIKNYLLFGHARTF